MVNCRIIIDKRTKCGYTEGDILFFCLINTYIIMAGQEVALSLAHRHLKCVSTSFMALHKMRREKAEIFLSPADRVELFMSRAFSRYCAFEHIQDGEIIQVAVGAHWRESITIIGGDEELPIFFEGVEAVRFSEAPVKPYFVGLSSRWVCNAFQRRANRLVYAETYLVRIVDGDYQPVLLLKHEGWLNAESVKKAFSLLAAYYDDLPEAGMSCGRVMPDGGKVIPLAWCVGMQKHQRWAMICDLNNGMIQIQSWDKLVCKPENRDFVQTGLIYLRKKQEKPLVFERVD